MSRAFHHLAIEIITMRKLLTSHRRGEKTQSAHENKVICIIKTNTGNAADEGEKNNNNHAQTPLPTFSLSRQFTSLLLFVLSLHIADKKKGGQELNLKQPIIGNTKN